jgi:signal transduction histidine kinase
MQPHPRPTQHPPEHQPEPTPLSVDELEALVDATREIAAILELEPVLQLIVDRVRGLVRAEYAALGIVGGEGRIDRFVTSGISAEDRARIGALPRGLGLLGLIIREGRSYRIADISQHPDSAGFPPNHPSMTSFLGVPISIHGRSVGNLYLTNKLDAAEFSEADRLLVEMFSLRAGIAIENARLHEQVQRLAVVEERERISRDLHDGIIQAIYGVALSLEDVPALMESDPEEAEVRVDHAIDSLNLAIREIRNFILGLRSELLHGADVVAGMATLAEEFATSGTADVDLDLSVSSEVTARLPMTHRVQLLQMTREAMSNAARHAHANRIRLSMHSEDDHLELTVEDDGVGFDAENEPPAGHLGLANLRQRAAALGGIMTIESSPGQGTRLSIRIPLTSEERPQ